MSLIQTEIERRGIATVALSVMRDVTDRLAPVRALVVDAPLGAPVGPPHDRVRHALVLRRMLALTTRADVPVVDTC